MNLLSDIEGNFISICQGSLLSQHISDRQSFIQVIMQCTSSMVNSFGNNHLKILKCTYFYVKVI